MKCNCQKTEMPLGASGLKAIGRGHFGNFITKMPIQSRSVVELGEGLLVFFLLSPAAEEEEEGAVPPSPSRHCRRAAATGAPSGHRRLEKGVGPPISPVR